MRIAEKMTKVQICNTLRISKVRFRDDQGHGVDQSIEPRRTHQRFICPKRKADHPSRGCETSKAKSPMPDNAELYTVLCRLTPERRRKAISSLLSEPQRLELESWLVAGGHRLGRKCSTRTTAGRHRSIGNTVIRRSWCSSAAADSPHSPVRGLVLYSQRSPVTGKVSRWYYAVACLHGLHVVARMHRDRNAAMRDHEALASLKHGTLTALSRGTTFDDALRECFRLNDHLTSPCLPSVFSSSEKAPIQSMARISKKAYASNMRFYAAVTLGKGYKTLVRSPCLHDLEVALAARQRLLRACSDAQVNLLSHSDCLEMLLRVRQEYAALHREHGSGHGIRHAIARFGNIESTILEQRDKNAWWLLRRLLVKRRRPSCACKLRSGSKAIASYEYQSSSSFAIKQCKKSSVYRSSGARGN